MRQSQEGDESRDYRLARDEEVGDHGTEMSIRELDEWWRGKMRGFSCAANRADGCGSGAGAGEAGSITPPQEVFVAQVYVLKKRKGEAQGVLHGVSPQFYVRTMM